MPTGYSCTGTRASWDPFIKRISKRSTVTPHGQTGWGQEFSFMRAVGERHLATTVLCVHRIHLTCTPHASSFPRLARILNVYSDFPCCPSSIALQPLTLTMLLLKSSHVNGVHVSRLVLAGINFVNSHLPHMDPMPCLVYLLYLGIYRLGRTAPAAQDTTSHMHDKDAYSVTTSQIGIVF